MHEKALQQEFMKLISAMRRDCDLFVDACGFALGAPHAEPYAAHLAISKAKKGRLCNG